MSLSRTETKDVPPSSSPGFALTATRQSEPEIDRVDIRPSLPRWQGALTIITVGLMTMMSTVLGGVLAVALPKIAVTLGLEESLLLWPASVYPLACGCTLLLSGSIADVVGSRLIYLIGSGLSACLVLASGLSQTGIQLIIFRALHGIAISLCLPSSISIITSTFDAGQRRNVAFACLGGAQPMGFLIGLVIGGILTDSIGWRPAFYLIAGINFAVLLISLVTLPKSEAMNRGNMFHRFSTSIDWIGVLMISASLGLLSYVLAAITANTSTVSLPSHIALLIIAVLLLPAFVYWVHRQEKLGRPALIPNSIWRNPGFSSICIAVFFAWATVTANQYFLSLYFQKVQLLSTFDTSLRFLPLVASGVLTNIVTGSLVRTTRADMLIAASVFLSAVTPLVMAVIKPNVIYWAAAFPATIMSPVWADMTLVVTNLVITQVFPPSTHGLAGGVSNTLAQLGTSLGLNLAAILASAVTKASSETDKTSPAALEKGYRAAFWASFALTVGTLVVIGLGMRRIGKVGGPKND